jgi:arabinose-5-phosphate isomerase
MGHIHRAQEIIDVEIEGIQKVRDNLDDSFDLAVETILEALKAGGKIVVTGVGKNLPIAEKISSTLASTGSTSVVLNPSQALHGDMGIFSNADILLALSYSGESEEILSFLPHVKRLNVKLVSITGSATNQLAQSSDVAIVATVDREACPFNMAPTASTTATLAVGDALAMVLLEAQGFEKEDYAKLHPGGAIGRALLLKVSDIMRTGDRVAVVRKNMKVQDALVAMTQARAGSAGIVDDDNHVLGIFTDGDLRRHLPEKENLLDLPIEDVMTESPFTVSADHLAVDVLWIFEEHSFDDLLVVDKDKRLIGAIDVQDLPKLKIL